MLTMVSSVSASDSSIPVTNPALVPNSLALRIDNGTFEIRRLRVSSSASEQDFILMLPVPGSVHFHSVGR